VKFTTGDKDEVVGTVEYHVQPESTGTEHAQVELYAALPVATQITNVFRTIGKADEEVCSIKVNGDSDSAQPIDPVAVSISYPIPPSKSQPRTVKRPYFHFRMPFEVEMTQFDWELNPVENEPLAVYSDAQTGG
jgi:hypothetical protein